MQAEAHTKICEVRCQLQVLDDRLSLFESTLDTESQHPAKGTGAEGLQRQLMRRVTGKSKVRNRDDSRVSLEESGAALV